MYPKNESIGTFLTPAILLHVKIHRKIHRLPHMIGRRISDLSSNEEIFNQAAPLYNQALRNSGFNEEISYSERNARRNKGRKTKIRDYQYSGPKDTKIVVHTVQLYTRYCRFAASAAATHTARTR